MFVLASKMLRSGVDTSKHKESLISTKQTLHTGTRQCMSQATIIRPVCMCRDQKLFFGCSRTFSYVPWDVMKCVCFDRYVDCQGHGIYWWNLARNTINMASRTVAMSDVPKNIEWHMYVHIFTRPGERHADGTYRSEMMKRWLMYKTTRDMVQETSLFRS